MSNETDVQFTTIIGGLQAHNANAHWTSRDRGVAPLLNVIEAPTWIRRQAPLSNVVQARLPNAAALKEYLMIRSDNRRSEITPQFHTDGVHRRLTFRVTAPQNASASPPAATVDGRQFQQMQANGISVTRFAVVNGALTGAPRTTVADDKQSAVLNSPEIAEALREGNGTAELYLE